MPYYMLMSEIASHDHSLPLYLAIYLSFSILGGPLYDKDAYVCFSILLSYMHMRVVSLG